MDLSDPHFLALAAEHQLLHSEYDDYGMANTSGVTCFRSIALFVSSSFPLVTINYNIKGGLILYFYHNLQLMLVLLVRHALIVATDSGLMQESSTFFNVSSAW